MWSWTTNVTDKLVDLLDDGSFFRQPWRAVYRGLAILLGVGGIVAALAVLGSAVYGCVKLYEADQYVPAVLGMQVGVLAGLACLFVGFFLARLWWTRADDLDQHTEGHRVFLAGPIVAHVFRTLTEALGSAAGFIGVLSFLVIWPLANGLDDIPFVGGWLRSMVGPSPLVLVAAPVGGFLTMMLGRWFAEGIEVLFAIANNTRLQRHGQEPISPAPPAASTTQFTWAGFAIGVLCYLMMALPLHEYLPLIPVLAALWLAMSRNWSASATALVGIAIAIAVRGVFRLVAENDERSAAWVYIEKEQPLLIFLLVLICLAVALLLRERNGRLQVGFSRPRVWAQGLAIAVVYSLYPTVETIREHLRRHSLTTVELQQAADLFKPYEGRRFGWRLFAGVDTAATFIVSAPQFDVDPYGTIMFQHALQNGRDLLRSTFSLSHEAIGLPDSLLYTRSQGVVMLHYLNGDSIRFTMRNGDATFTQMAVAVDVVARLQADVLAGREARFDAYRDSLHTLTDTLQGRFHSYDCSGAACYAWFGVETPDGVVKRPFYCATSTVSGFPMDALPRDDARWTIVSRQTTLANAEAFDEGAAPVIYELYVLMPEVKAEDAIREPAAKEPPTSTGPVRNGSGAESATLAKPKVYAVNEVDQAPRFPGGNRALKAYLATRQYPAAEKVAGQVAKVRVSFVVSQTGQVREVTVSNPGNANFDTEAKRLITGMVGWEPGLKDGRPVDVRMTETVNFSLND